MILQADKNNFVSTEQISRILAIRERDKTTEPVRYVLYLAGLNEGVTVHGDFVAPFERWLDSQLSPAVKPDLKPDAKDKKVA